FSSSLHESLYRRGIELKEAYKRIEELAELDELTGSLNRRSIMQTLDEEIASSRRSKTPCAVALIDLDWFKR
ncbi:GGDEF domain-containing protein, partial [Klebsiella pneumoniae]|nr:GGDEF domain-containing protein [Klebsiella pneumoniae]